MKLEKAISGPIPLVIEHPLGGLRIIAYGEIVRGGFLFLDVGWDDPLGGRHPVHFAEGKITGSGPWRIGDATIREIEEQEPIMDHALAWCAVAPPQEKAREALRRSDLYPDETENAG